MATAKLKRKPRLSKIESYKAANIKRSVVSPQVLCRCSWAHTRLCCGQGAALSLCVVRLGSGRFGVGFLVGLRAWDFRTEKVLSRAPLIIRIRTADHIFFIYQIPIANRIPAASNLITHQDLIGSRTSTKKVIQRQNQKKTENQKKTKENERKPEEKKTALRRRN
jgi:hypothetical protein